MGSAQGLKERSSVHFWDQKGINVAEAPVDAQALRNIPMSERVIQSEWVLHAKLERIWWLLQGESKLWGGLV